MGDQEQDDLKMALRLSMQHHESPEPKRSKPFDNSTGGGDDPQPVESPALKNRRMQRELMAAAAEKRMAAARSAAPTAVRNEEDTKIKGTEQETKGRAVMERRLRAKVEVVCARNYRLGRLISCS